MPNKIRSFLSGATTLMVVKNGTKNYFMTSILAHEMDVFFSSRCLNNRIDLPDQIGSFSSGATTSMVVKNGTKKTLNTKIRIKS